MRPGKLRLVVEMQTSGPLMRPNVSRGPPRHAAHEASSEIWQPASRKMSSSGRPSMRSEEHTSELQSQSNLVCRLLLEKKKKIQTQQGRSSGTDRSEHTRPS